MHEKVKLKAISKKGKDVINRFGDIRVIMKKDFKVSFSDHIGGWMLIASEGYDMRDFRKSKGKDLRWVNEDPDVDGNFIIEPCP